MERSLLGSVFALGCVGWLCGLVLTRIRRGEVTEAGDGIPRPVLMPALALPILVFLATLPTRPPFFATGQGFGRGFLMGSVAALLGAWVVVRIRRLPTAGGEPTFETLRSAGTAGAYAMALPVAVAPLLWMRQTMIDALAGIAIGWVCNTFILIAGASRRDGKAKLRDLPLTASAGFTVTLCAELALGQYRGPVSLFSTANAVSWSAIAAIVAAGVPFALLLSALPSSFFARIAFKLPLSSVFTGLAGRMFQTTDARQAAVRVWRLVCCVVVLLLLGRLLYARLIDHEPVFRLIGVGLLVGILACRLSASRLREERTAGSNPFTDWQNGALAVLVVLAGVMVGYQMLAGIGVGLVLIAAWPMAGLAVAGALEQESSDISAPANASEESGTAVTSATNLVRLLIFGTVLLLYRLFVTRFENDLHNVGLTDTYAVFGFFVGAMLPALLSGFLLRSASEGTAGRSLRLVVAGALTLGVPAIVLALWGAKCVLTLLIGLALSVVVTEAVEPRAREDNAALLPALFALAVGLALAQWTHHVLPMTLLSRAAKIRALAEGVGALAILILLSDYGGRLSRRRRHRQEGVGQPAAEGAAK